MDNTLKLLFRNIAIRQSYFPCLVKNLDLEDAVKEGARLFRRTALRNSTFGTKTKGQMYSWVLHSGMIRTYEYTVDEIKFRELDESQKSDSVIHGRDKSTLNLIIDKLVRAGSFDCSDGRIFYITLEKERYRLYCPK